MNKKYFAFLRRLQAQGRNNMYGAVPYLMRTFNLNREQAFAVVCEWIDLQATVAQSTSPVVFRPHKRTESARSNIGRLNKTIA
jgi:hypothetical protein